MNFDLNQALRTLAYFAFLSLMYHFYGLDLTVILGLSYCLGIVSRPTQSLNIRAALKSIGERINTGESTKDIQALEEELNERINKKI